MFPQVSCGNPAISLCISTGLPSSARLCRHLRQTVLDKLRAVRVACRRDNNQGA